MTAELHLLIGIVAIHAAWAVVYLTGTIADARLPHPQTRAQALTSFVVRSATGLALWAFGGMLLAFVHGLAPWGIAVLGAGFIGAARAVHGPALFSAGFWRDQAARVGAAFGPANLILYYAGLLTIVPAAFPDIDSDSVRYHLAYAADWANHGWLFPDRFLRQPFYANNFLLIFSEFDVLKAAAYVHFATWLCGGMTVLAVRSALQLIDDAAPASPGVWARRARSAVTFLLPLTIVVSPVFLRWQNTGMVDIPMELYVFIPALCAVAALTSGQDLRWSAVVCAAFLLGMKVTLFTFAPLFAGTIWLLVAVVGGSRKARALACAIMLLLGSPWYVRNVVYDHDPVPPLLNLALHRDDLTYNVDDAKAVLQDIAPDRSIRALGKLPYRAYMDPGNPSLREYGTSGLFLFLYVPLIVVAGALAFGARTNRDRALVLLSATSAYALLYCLATSYLLRYLLITSAPLAASIGALLLWLPGARAASVARAAIAALSVAPTPSALWWYDHQWRANYLGFEARYSSDRAFLERDLRGYDATERVLAAPIFARRPAPKVLLIRVETEYYFRLAGIETVGDWSGPGRFADLQMAIDNDRVPDYLRHFGIGAVILDRGRPVLDEDQYASFVRALRRLGYRVDEGTPAGSMTAIRS